MNRSQKLDQLVRELDRVLAQLPDDQDPDLRRLRDRADDAIFDAWVVVSRPPTRASNTLAQFSKYVNAVVRSRPWLIVCAAALIAAAAGYALSPRDPPAGGLE
jgi:ElaB/YqjD/DUF883 family membrane-anchored ribosome-binding protein